MGNLKHENQFKKHLIDQKTKETLIGPNFSRVHA